MSYLSTLRGRLEIVPPLPWAIYRDSPFRASGFECGDSNLAVRLEEVKEAQDIPDGVVEWRAAIAVVPRHEDREKYYDLTQNLEALIAAFPGHEFRGHLVRDGEDTEDIERYWITDGALHSEKAELRWPDGSTVEL